MSRKLKSAMSTFIRNRIPLTDAQLQAASPTEVFKMAYAALEGIVEVGGTIPAHS